jgi:poly-gamma-glutamate capsule biosynthesis protein CapA/YwtB (metallophosphatase superfamily)
MKNRESIKHIDQQLQRREFMSYALAAGIAMVCRPIGAQAIMGHTAARASEADATKLRSHATSLLRLFLCGDVMTGRGIDQILPHAGNPVLYERHMRSATGYVELAEEANGPIRKPVEYSYIWGDALAELARRKPQLRIINLETAVTRSDDVADKAVNYRMQPDNIPCINAANIDCCTLANNHVLDWGYEGLAETLRVLKAADIEIAGAGMNLQQARAPALLPVPGKGRVLVFSFGSETSGIPQSWAATADKAGVNLLPDLSSETVRGIRDSIEQTKLTGDVAVLSIHWGGNWGYEVPREQLEFAHRLIDEAGVDIVHGHSSHHVKGMEVYKGKLVLYGCGDFLNDYEGITGYEAYRGDLVLMYFPSLDPSTGNLISLHMTPMQIKRFRLNRVLDNDVLWLKNVLNREGKKFGTSVVLSADNTLMLGWTSSN